MAEDSVRSGRDGEKIAKEIVNLIGWQSAAWNMDIDCAYPSRHKAGNKNQNWHHGLDMFYSYDNPLYHDRRDVVVGSVKHAENGYASSINSNLATYIAELSVSIECAKASDTIGQYVGSSNLKTHVKGVIFCLSSDDSEKETDLTKKLSSNLDLGGNQFEEIFLVDNKRATFLVSCIKTAQQYMPHSPVNFLYQNTGKNMDKAQLLISGRKLPVQLINSEIIPIVKEEHGKIACLIFCNNSYSKEHASRLIWLSHKLCGLTNEIRIYLPNYDHNKEYEVNAVKQVFRDESFTSKISFHRLNKFDFISLKETQEQYRYTDNKISGKVEISHSVQIGDDIDKILPYGDILLPKLKTSVLSEGNLREFLMMKGIITLKQNKEEILPVFSCLLLSPEELDRLKSTYREKEEKPKEIERKAKVDLGNKTLWEVFNTCFPDLKTFEGGLSKHCTFIDRPALERVNSNYNHLIVKCKIEKENTNKDFLTGKSYYDSHVEIRYERNEIIFLDKHTSFETYKLNKVYFDNFQKALKKNNFLLEEFKSIRFLDFGNNERIQFLLQFLKLRDSKALKIKRMSLEGMKFRADDDIEVMPKDLASLKGRVSNLNLHGKELDDTIYLTDKEYRTAELCEKMRFSASYDYMNRSGLCYIDVSFNNALTPEGYKDAELRISITPSTNSADSNFVSAKAVISKEVNKVKQDGYARFKTLKTGTP